jgi:hypothetical protein
MKNKIVLLLIGALWIITPQVSYAAFPVKSNSVAEQKTITENVHKDAELLQEKQVMAPALRNKNNSDTQKGNGFGIAALSCALVGMRVPFFGVLAIIFGAIGMSKNRSLRGLAIAGFVLGILELIISVLALIIILAFF